MVPKDARAASTDKIRAQFGDRDALFGISRSMPKLVELRIERIRTNPDQPRKAFDESSLGELAASIDSHGLIQPITVKRIEDDDSYMIVAGERRFRAFQILNRETITALITTGSPDEIALIENLQREDLRPLDQAEALARLMERHRYTQEELARVIGKARTTVTELLSLNALPDEVKAECRTSDVATKSLLVEIARLKEPDAQLALWNQVKGGGTVRGARAKKDAGEVRDNQTPTTKMLAAGRSFVRRLQRTSPSDLAANRDQYRELLELKKALDTIINESVESIEADKGL